MFTKFLGATLFVLCIVFARSAYAIDNAGTVGDCSNATVDNIEQCLMGDALSDSTSAGKTPEVPCPTAKDYATCIKKCDCEWGKAKNKCNGGLACLDVANAEHDANVDVAVTFEEGASLTLGDRLEAIRGQIHVRRQHGDSVTRFEASAAIDGTRAHCLGRRNETVTSRLADQRDIADAQRAFEYEQNVLFRHRPAR